MKICRLQDSGFTYSDVVELIKASFVQWQEKGLQSSLSRLTPETFAERTAKCLVLVAVDTEQNELLGTASVQVFHSKNASWAYNKFLAIKPGHKRQGLATQLLQYRIDYAKSQGCQYILSDTSVHAKWSVRWHLKNGFKIVGLTSLSSNDYYSYLFRMQLANPSPWSNSAYCKMRYLGSSIKTRLMFRSSGDMTALGRFAARLKGRLHG